MAIGWRGASVIAARLPDADVESTLRSLHRSLPGAVEARPDPAMARVIERMQAHVLGEPVAFDDVVLDLGGRPAFTRKVLEALRRVPRGSTISYAGLAALAGSPGASRAVGTALARNPIPLIVPCHRVLASNGLGGFSGGVGPATKRRLLVIEGVQIT